MDAASATSHMRKLVPLIYIKRISISSGDAVTWRPLSQLANLPIHLNVGKVWECVAGPRKGGCKYCMKWLTETDALSEFKLSAECTSSVRPTSSSFSRKCRHRPKSKKVHYSHCRQALLNACRRRFSALHLCQVVSTPWFEMFSFQ